MLKIVSLLTALFSMFNYNSAFSGTSEYKCTVEAEINTENKSFIENGVFSGTSFIVNRSTGSIRGELISDSGFDKSIVVHPGDELNALKVISYAYLDAMQTESNMQYLHISSYEKFNKKGFVYHNGLHLLIGYCF